MFSDAEREFLRLMGEGSPEARAAALELRFPNPTYRRRLLWGIRRKVVAASADWQLYAEAVRNEPRAVRPHDASAPPPEVPTYTEPLAALFEGLAARLREVRNRRQGTRPRGSP